MKLINFKILPFMLSGFALLALNGCDGTTGTSSDSGIMYGDNVAQDNVAPIITENPSIASASILDGNISLTVNEDVTAGVYVNGSLIDTTSDLVQDISGVLTVNVQDTLINVSEGQIIVKDAAGNEAVSTTTVGLGTSGNDIITGDSNPNLIFGFDGNDTLRASGGIDSLAGGDGNDYFDYDEGRADISLAADTLVDGGNGADELYVWNGAGALILSDTDFANVRNMEMLTLAAIGGSTVTLGENTDAAFSTGIVIKHAHSSALIVNGEISTVDITVTGSPSTDILSGGDGDDTFKTTIALLSADIIDGGAHIGGDTIKFTDTGTINDGTLGNTISNVEKIQLANGTNTVAISANGPLKDYTIIGGSGTDTFSLGDPNSIYSALYLDGGTGAAIDTLNVWNGGGSVLLVDSDFTNMSNMEALVLGAAGANTSVTIGAEASGAFANGITITQDIFTSDNAVLTVNGTGVTVAIDATGGDLADTLIGGTRADILAGGAGADTLTGGAGPDRMDVGVDNAIDTINLSTLSNSVVSTGNSLTIGNISIGNTITYANGIDIIDNFDAANGDIIDVSTVFGPMGILNTQYGTSWAFILGANYYLSGAFNEATRVFTVMANGAGPDTLLIQGEGGTFFTNDSSVILLGVNSNDLTAANFK